MPWNTGRRLNAERPIRFESAKLSGQLDLQSLDVQGVGELIRSSFLIAGKLPIQSRSMPCGASMRSCPFEFLIVMTAALIGIGCSSDVPDVVPSVKLSAIDSSSEVTYRDVLVFSALPIVDDSEETLKLHDIVELKDRLAVLSESIGIEVADGMTDHLLSAGTLIPVQKSDIFSTIADGQQEVTITLVRGNSKHVSENHLIGNITVVGIPSATAGTPRLKWLLKVQRNGDVLVSASDQSNGKSLRLRLN